MHWIASGKKCLWADGRRRRYRPAFFLFFLLLLTGVAKAQTLTLSLANVPVEKAFREISAKTAYRFIYTQEVVQGLAPVSLELKGVHLKEALDLLFAQVPLTYALTDNYVQVKAVPAKMTAPVTKEITGKVVDEEGRPLPGATVTIRGRSQSTATDSSGGFRLSGVAANDRLVVSSVGFVTKEVAVEGRSFLEIRLSLAVSALDETVVMAYGTTTRRFSTGNIFKVTGEEIARQPVLNPLAALEGRVPGLVVTQTSGVPGSAVRLQLRGQSSIGTSPGNLPPTDPLILVDGVPFAANNSIVSQLQSMAGTPNVGAGSGGLSPLNLLNPADIESIEVLKDADATAIYGSRGANGVILISTKKGRPGKTRVQSTIYHGWSRAANTLQLLSTAQYLALRREALANDGTGPTASNAPDLVLWDTTRYTDFRKLLVGGTAPSVSAQVSLSGGNAGTRFQLGGGWNREGTVFPGDLAYRRASVQCNLAHATPDQRFQLVLSALYAADDNQALAEDLTAGIRLVPNAPALKDPEGRLVWQEKGVEFSNPLAALQKTYHSTSRNLLSNLQLRYRVLPGLELRSSAGYHSLQVKETSVLPLAAQPPTTGVQGSSSFGDNAFQSWIMEPQVEYTAKTGALQLTLLGGGTWQSEGHSRSRISAFGYTNDALLSSLGSAASLTATNEETDYRYTALFGRLTARWKEQYVLNLSGRRDGSSRFGPHHRFGNFGAVGAAWIFSAAKGFAKALPVVSFGKLRGSYGTTGNDQIGDYMYLDTWSATATPYQGLPGLMPTRLYNPDFAWEVNRKLELGLDLGLGGNRWLVSVALFRNRSSNQLLRYVVPAQTGFGAITTRNFPAVVENAGLELSADLKFIIRGPFRWTTALNFTAPRNRLVSFPGLATSSYKNTLVEGRSLRVSKGYEFLGVNPATGLFAVRDVDGDGFISSPNDLVITGNQDVRYSAGLTNTLQYGPFSFSFFVEGRRQTGRNPLATLYVMGAPGQYSSFANQPLAVLDRWHKPGDQAALQKVSANPFGPVSAAISNFTSTLASVTDASFLRLRTLSLSWNAPEPLMRRWHLASGQVYFRGQNLWTLTPYRGTDPETQNVFGLPPLQTLVAGFQLTF